MGLVEQEISDGRFRPGQGGTRPASRETDWTPRSPTDHDAWADALHNDRVAFIPPSMWEGETVGRFAFLHPHIPMELVREILARTA